jgi:uncharacterized protein (TIGR03437 family)
MPTLYRNLKSLSIPIFLISILGTPLLAYPVNVTINVNFSALPGQPDDFGLAGTPGVITTAIETDSGNSGSYPAAATVTLGSGGGITISNQPGTVAISANGQISATFGDGKGNSFSANLVIPPLASASALSFGSASFSAPVSSTSYTIGAFSGMVGITGTINAVGLTAAPLNGISATAMANGTSPADGQISVGSNSGGNFAYTASVSPASATWLTLTGATGMTPATVSAHFSTALVPATYTASVLVNTGSGTAGAIVIPVTYTVSAATTTPPVISGLSPSSAAAGGAAFPLTVNGSGFVASSAVYWNTTALPTTFVSATQLTAMVPASLIATVGTASVSVANPGNVTSSPSVFTIGSGGPPPTITTLSPPSATATGAAFTLTVTGTGFVSGALVKWNSTTLTTTFVSATQLTAAVTANLISAAGIASVVVTNPGGTSSAATTFTISPAAPVITSLSPTSATAGGPAFTLTVNGTGFLSGATVDWNGTALPTTLVSATQLTATVTASLIAVPASINITVVNPGGTPSSASAFPITAAGPVITSLTPTSAVATGPAFTLCANGTSFVSGATLDWNGAPLTTTTETTTQVCASVPANLIAAKGSASITVVNPGGATSPAVTLPINLPVPTITTGGVVPIFSSVPTIQAGSWISIYGTSLADNIYTWTGSFPTSLGGDTVTINGKPAYLWFVSPTQLNVQAPDDTMTGSVDVVVNTPYGPANSTVTLAPVAPSFNLFDSSKYVAGVIPTANGSGAYGGGTYDLLGPSGFFSFSTRPVKAGETVELYGVGFGPTTPPVPAGQVYNGPGAQTPAGAVTVTIGGMPATVAFSGITEAGSYQINVVIPATGSGDQLVQASVGGATTQSNVYITVQ